MRNACVFSWVAPLVLVTLSGSVEAQLWKRFIPVEQVGASPSEDYILVQENGPWLIMAATFTGEGAEEQARDLALEFRSRFNRRAYVHQMSFDFSTEGNLGRGIDKYGAPIRMRYQRGDRVREWAVLVGDFANVDDPHAQEVLEQIKRLKPDALKAEDGQTSQSLAHTRRLQKALIASLRNDTTHGPMRNAFLTRNPLLPDEYFVPRGVDKFVEQMNRGLEHSLLDCPGRYTVKVATFEGKSVIQGAASTASGRFKRKKEEQDPLVVAAENAHLLTVALRAKGWPAYEFHDRTESIVTIGSYDKPTQAAPDGSQVPIREVGIIVQTFGARYNTPANPLLGEPQSMADRAKADEVKQRFVQLLKSEDAQVVGGLKPKYVEVLKDRFITFDIHPHVMDVPTRSVSSSYAWR